MAFFSKEELKLLWPFYLEAFLGTLLFILIPFQILYFNSIGLNAKQIGIILAASPLAALLFEIPTGAIADLYGRKFSVMLGWVLHGILLISILFFSNFYYLVLIGLLLGISNTLTTGSYEAWVVDLLKARKMKNLISKYFSKKLSFYNSAFFFSGILGSLLVVKFGLAIIWPVSGIAMILSVFFLYFGEEKFRREKFNIKSSFGKLSGQIKNSFSYSYRHPVLFYLVMVGFIFGVVGVLGGSFISLTPLLKSFDFPDYAFGYLWSAMGFIGIISPLLSERFVKKGRERKFLVWISVIGIAYGFAILVSTNLIMLLLVILAGSFLSDFEIPIWKTYFHRFIPSRFRASIGNIQSLFASLSGIIALPVAGLLIDKIGAGYTIFISGLLMIPVIFFYSKIKEETKEEK